MAREDMVVMRRKELTHLHFVQKVIQGELTRVEAARMLRVSERQVRRWVERVKAEGERGLAHRSRGRRSNRSYADAVKAKVVGLYRQRYRDFGPTLFAEKLHEREGIELGQETVRRWLKEAGLWTGSRRPRRHHRWRERKRYCGEMIQFDGSHHDWLEGRGPHLVLMSQVDDATGRVSARFYEYEGTIPAMDSFRRYVRRFGLPSSIYLDNHTTYKSPAEPTVEERLAGRRPQSQFERAMEELRVEVIHSHSAQARGRVERSFRTHQDRLVKEMRLEEIASMEAANAFLSRYLVAHNRRFTREALGDVHRPLTDGIDLDAVLSIRTMRRVRNDGTLLYGQTLYQILTRARPASVRVEQRLNGQMCITHHGRRLSYRPVTKPAVAPPRRAPDVRCHVAPRENHPWKKGLPPLRTKEPKTGHF